LAAARRQERPEGTTLIIRQLCPRLGNGFSVGHACGQLIRVVATVPGIHCDVPEEGDRLQARALGIE
jgi:hypothetical protein